MFCASSAFQKTVLLFAIWAVVFPLSVGIGELMARIDALSELSASTRGAAMTALLILGMEFAVLPLLTRLMRRLFRPPAP